MVNGIRRLCGLAGAGGNKLGAYLTQLWRVILLQIGGLVAQDAFAELIP